MVCPVSTTKGQGSYVELFPINAFPSEKQSKRKWFFSLGLLRFCIILGDIKYSSIYTFSISSISF